MKFRIYFHKFIVIVGNINNNNVITIVNKIIKRSKKKNSIKPSQ